VGEAVGERGSFEFLVTSFQLEGKILPINANEARERERGDTD
jgi:hypothetical protein